jgi:hypothetical protein
MARILTPASLGILWVVVVLSITAIVSIGRISGLENRRPAVATETERLLCKAFILGGMGRWGVEAQSSPIEQVMLFSQIVFPDDKAIMDFAKTISRATFQSEPIIDEEWQLSSAGFARGLESELAMTMPGWFDFGILPKLKGISYQAEFHEGGQGRPVVATSRVRIWIDRTNRTAYVQETIGERKKGSWVDSDLGVSWTCELVEYGYRTGGANRFDLVYSEAAGVLSLTQIVWADDAAFTVFTQQLASGDHTRTREQDQAGLKEVVGGLLSSVRRIPVWFDTDLKGKKVVRRDSYYTENSLGAFYWIDSERRSLYCVEECLPLNKLFD